MLSLQDVFNVGWQKFVVEKAPPSFESGLCLYYGPNGAKCLFGFLIPVQGYREWQEGEHPTRVTALREVVRFDDHPNVVWREIQNCHDQAAQLARQNLAKFHELVTYNLNRFAEKYDLTIPAPQFHSFEPVEMKPCVFCAPRKITVL